MVKLRAAAQRSATACCGSITSGVIDAAAAQTAAALLKALADPVRLRLFSAIQSAGEALCVCDLPDVGVAQPTVSHHLKRLREAGLIDCERRGTWVYYWPRPAALDALQRLIGTPAPLRS